MSSSSTPNQSVTPRGNPAVGSIRSLFENQNARRMSRKRSRSPVQSLDFDSTMGQIEDLRWKLRTEDYYRLLDSYTVDRWQGMPWPVNPINLALNGWECYAPGVVRCSTCHKAYTFDLFSYHEVYLSHSLTDQTMRSWLITDFTTKVADGGHELSCTFQPLWRGSAVNQFANFDLRSFREWYTSRLESLLPCREKLPVLSTALYERLGECKEFSSIIRSKAWIFVSLMVQKTAVILALHGWRLSKPRSSVDKDCLSCRECRQEIDYSTFCPLDRLPVLEQNEQDNFHTSMFSAWSQPEVEYRFDCRTGHAAWCPWIRPVPLSEDMKTLFGEKPSREMTGIEATLAAFSYDSVKGRAESTFEDLQFQVDSLRSRLDNARNEAQVFRTQGSTTTEREPQV